MSVHYLHSRVSRLAAVALAVLLTAHAPASVATWTGAGTDDRWVNPGNWEGGVLPTAADDIAFADVNWWQHPELHTTVTIDSAASANVLSFFFYAAPPMPFSDIKVRPGASFALHEEHVDQSLMLPARYSQTGGIHEVATDFSYTSAHGQFTMTDGTFAVGGMLSLRPEHGTVNITGGRVEAGNLWLHAWQNSYAISGTTALYVHDALNVGGELVPGQSMYLGCPAYMLGADYLNQFYYDDFHDLVDLRDLRLTFESVDQTASTFECASVDLGPSAAGFVDNFVVGELGIGDAATGYVQLVDSFDNQSEAEAAYVHDLEVGVGSILDLNSKTIYADNLVALDGTVYYASDGYREFLPGAYPGLIGSGGRIVLIPEPGALIGLLLAGAAAARCRSIPAERNAAPR